MTLTTAHLLDTLINLTFWIVWLALAVTALGVKVKR